jgi:hypothetical protein
MRRIIPLWLTSSGSFEKRKVYFQPLALWTIRIVAAWVLLNTIKPPDAIAPLEAQQSVETVKSQVCVHTRLIDEVGEWKIQRSLQLVRKMGADTIVEFFPWAYFEPAEGHYNWGQADRIVRHAKNQGLHIIARMGFVPAWARPDVDDLFTTLNYLPDEYFDEFADFVAQFAARYAGTIDHIIIWNEPNLTFEWGYRAVDPAGYARLLEVVYPQAHEANPNVIILVAPLAPTLEPPGSTNGLNDLLYLEALYEAGANNNFDALAMHTYGFTEPPENPPAPDLLNFRRAELLHEIMVRYGDVEKPVYITEFGWNDNPRWTKAVRPSLRVGYTIGAFAWAEQHWTWANKLCVWALRYPMATRSYPDNFTLITDDFQLKPIYFAIQAYARGWETDARLWLPAPEER